MATRPPQAGSVIGNANSTGATAIARSADLNRLSLLRTEGERKRQAEAANSYLFDFSTENSSNPAHFFAGIMQNHPANRLFGAPGARPARCGPVPCMGWMVCQWIEAGGASLPIAGDCAGLGGGVGTVGKGEIFFPIFPRSKQQGRTYANFVCPCVSCLKSRRA